MTARLTAIFGPLQGSTLALTDSEISIGREPSNTLCISDMLLSRKHCVVKKDGERFTITDLGSLNGIFVNKMRTREKVLEKNDQIQIGESLFLFLDRDDEEFASQAEMNKSGLTAQSTTRLRIEDAIYLKSQEPGTKLPPAERMSRDLKSLLNISNALNSAQETKAIQNKLMELVFQVIPAQRGAILLKANNSDELTSAYALDRLSGAAIQVSHSIAYQAFQERTAILCNGVTQSEVLEKAESLVTSRIHALLCVPLIAFQKSLGVLYLDTSDPSVLFDEGHLQLLAGVAGIAAIALKNAGQFDQLKDENIRLQSEIGHQMVGESPPMRKIYELIAKIAPTDSTALICGETGTGKELAARAIHLNSPRADKPFIAINCAALTETLLESELFGHEKGAFTGAVTQKKGKLELADGGTLFLDEISEFATTLQAKLLRFLQEREFERVGGTHPIKINVRLITATNKNLEENVESGTFRQDLYFRLNVISITIPPLRERRDDIPLLASYFTSKCSKKLRRSFTEISQEALKFLMAYDWPGNVRELENTIERAMVLGYSDRILPEDLPETVLEIEAPFGVPITTYHQRLKETKKQLVEDAFQRTGGNHHEAAKLLGVHPQYLYRLIRNLKLKVAP